MQSINITYAKIQSEKTLIKKVNYYELNNVDLNKKLYEIFFNAKKIAIDLEMSGLNPNKHQLCKIQLYNKEANTFCVISIDEHVLLNKIKFKNQIYTIFPLLDSILSCGNIIKIFHYSFTDIAFLESVGFKVNNVFCTYIASKIFRTYSDKHSLKDLLEEFLQIEISKKLQQTFWGHPISKYSLEEKKYLITDVIFLHDLEEKLTRIGFLTKNTSKYNLAIKLTKTIPSLINEEINVNDFVKIN